MSVNGYVYRVAQKWSTVPLGRFTYTNFMNKNFQEKKWFIYEKVSRTSTHDREEKKEEEKEEEDEEEEKEKKKKNQEEEQEKKLKIEKKKREEWE
ncbi:hypothetical protein M8J76_000810 [Diaphorina citri]|nr:hypothetical protein M8J76_000810 [Diaphorina citri]